MTRILVALACLAGAFQCAAQVYPTKPIRVIFPYPGGSVPDALGRQITQGVSAIFGQPLVFENRGGANGILGTEATAKSPPDGYTISWTNTSAFTYNSFLQKSLPYHPLKDFAPLTAALDVPMAVMVHSSVPANSVRELVEHARRNKGKLTYGTFGNGSLPHLYGELINRSAGTDLLHVPFKGAAALVTDFLAGRVDVTYVSVGSVVQHWKSGKVKVLAMASPKRHPQLPDLPSVLEDLPKLELMPNWMGFVAPAGVSRPIVSQLHGALVKVINSPELRRRFDELYYSPMATTPEEFAALLKHEFAVAGAAFKLAGIQPE